MLTFKYLPRLVYFTMSISVVQFWTSKCFVLKINIMHGNTTGGGGQSNIKWRVQSSTQDSARTMGYSGVVGGRSHCGVFRWQVEKDTHLGSKIFRTCHTLQRYDLCLTYFYKLVSAPTFQADSGLSFKWHCATAHYSDVCKHHRELSVDLHDGWFCDGLIAAVKTWELMCAFVVSNPSGLHVLERLFGQFTRLRLVLKSPRESFFLHISLLMSSRYLYTIYWK